MALLSLEGTLEKENRSIDGALLKISQALCGLASSLQEFREVETMLGLESAAEADDSGTNDASPNFLGVVAGTLKEMVGKLVSDIEAKPEIQKLLLVIQKSGSVAANQCATIAKQGSSSVVGAVTSGEELVCSSGRHSRIVKRAVGCRHFCAVHLEVMDPYLWSALPVELVQLALARLSMAEILDIYAHSALSTMARSVNFRQVCFEWHPKVFGLVGQGRSGAELRNAVYDIKLKKWIDRDLVGFRRAFGITENDRQVYMSNSKYACDGGLVCFVPQTRMLTSSSVRIGNPLTDEWKALPCLPRLPSENWKVIMVQLATEEDTKCYKVILVFGDDRKMTYAAQCYDSKTGAWSSMESGLVYGNVYDSFVHNQVDGPRVFDCETKTMYQLVDRTTRGSTLKTMETTYKFDPYRRGSEPGVHAIRCAMVKDGRLFVLHECSSESHGSMGLQNPHNPMGFQGPHGLMGFQNPLNPYRYAWQSKTRFQISEYAWQSNTSELRIINSSAPKSLPSNNNLIFFASGRSVFLLVNNGGSRETQLMIRLYDSSANDWHRLPNMKDDIRNQVSVSKLKDFFWCELRWDAVP